MPPPKPKPKSGLGEMIGETPTELRTKVPNFGGAGSSVGGGMPLKHRGKGTGVIPAAVTASTGVTGDPHLANLSNLVIGSPRSRRFQPAITGPPPRGAGEKKHASVPSVTRARSNTPSPKGSPLSRVRSNTPSARAYPLSGFKKNTPSPRSSTLARSNTPPTKGSSMRTAPLTSSLTLLSINNVETPTSPSPDAPGDIAACSSGESATNPGTMEKSGKGSIGGDVHRRPCLTARAGVGLSGGGVPQSPRSTVTAGAGLNCGDVQQRPGLTAKTGAGLSTRAVTGTQEKKHAVTGLKGETQKVQHVMKSGLGLNGQMLQKNHALTDLKREAQKENQEHHIKKLGRGSGGGMLQKKHRKKKTMQSEDVNVDMEICLTEETMKKVQEADLMIQKLSELGLGEDISDEELRRYSEQLPCKPPYVDTSIELHGEELNKLYARHLLYRIKCYKLTQGWRKNEPHNAELEKDGDDFSLHNLQILNILSFDEDEAALTVDHILDYLEKEGLLQHITSDSTFDWAFEYCTVAGLDDYQRIVLQNYGGFEYVHWDAYRKYFNDYETELEYLDFWDELSKKLKWMEDYVHMNGPSLMWGRIWNRGASQAIKIAAGFSKISGDLAYAAYKECVDSMCSDIFIYRDLEGVYFEVWKRVAKLKKSFRAALDEVYKLDKFPLRQDRMKYALESDVSQMEKEFYDFTEDVADEASEDNAQELIIEAMAKTVGRPKYYAHYIKRKIEIARSIGVISVVSP